MARENLFNVLNNLVDYDACTALDLFAGTGAISFEFLSRGCTAVTAVERAATQYRFILKVKELLHDSALTAIRADVFKFIASCRQSFDIVFADPPYDLPRLPELPELILGSNLVKPGTLVIVEHSAANDFAHLPQFTERRIYGKVNFSLFTVPMEDVRWKM